MGQTYGAEMDRATFCDEQLAAHVALIAAHLSASSLHSLDTPSAAHHARKSGLFGGVTVLLILGRLIASSL